MKSELGRANLGAGDRLKPEDVIIMHPKTNMVDSPDWDPAAPDLEVEGATPGRIEAGVERRRSPAPVAAKMDDEGARRLLLALGLAIAGFAGVAFAVHLLLDADEGEARSSVEASAADEPERADSTAPEPALEPSPGPDLAALEGAYRGHVAATAAALGVEAPTLERLRQPAAFSHPISHGEPRVLGPGKSLRVGELSLRVSVVQGLSVDRITISSKAQHTLLVVENHGQVPVAYHLLARKQAGAKCLTPAIIPYDALVIDPGQRFEISICSGRQRVEIIDLRTLELSAVGAAWVRQMPPRAVGLGGVTAKAHEVAEGTAQCSEDEEMLERALHEGELAWEDVVDFYSRHDCTHYPWPSDYRFEDGQGSARLPIVAPWNPGASPYDAKPDEP